MRQSRLRFAATLAPGLALLACVLAPVQARHPYGTSGPMPARVVASVNAGLASAIEGNPDFDTPPVLVEAYMPIFPISRRLNGIAGVCRIVFGVDADGLVLDPHRDPAVEADDKMCAHARIAMRTWRFKPATKAGHPVAVQEAGTIPFQYDFY